MEESFAVSQKKGITGTGLKIIAMVAMFIDHFAAILISDYLESTIPNISQPELQEWFMEHRMVAVLEMVMGIMRLIGRFGFPLFAFLLVEGFTHTRSVKKYAINLGIFALISELPFNLGFSSILFFPGYQNVFFTLLLGLLCIASISGLCEHQRENEQMKPLFYLAALLSGPFAVYMLVKNAWVVYLFWQPDGDRLLIAMGIAAVLSLAVFAFLGRKWDSSQKNIFTFTVFPLIVFAMAAEFLMTDYSGGGVLTIVCMYLLRKKRKLAFSIGMVVLTLMSPAEATAFLMLIPLSKYNGERGMKINKYFFYAFYPLHIGLLYLITLLLGFTTFALH